MMRQFRSQRRSRKGVILPLLAVAIVVLVAVAGLSIDAGRMFAARREAQAAADAAAMAAAVDLYDASVAGQSILPIAKARASALAIAADNGYANDGSDSVVTVNSPPTSGLYAGQKGYAEVIIESRQTRSFSRIFGQGQTQVKARSVAAGTLVPTTATVLVLDPKSKKALSLKRGGTVLEAKGDIIVNTKDKQPADIGPGAELVAENIMFTAKLDKRTTKMLQQRARGDVFQKVDPTPDPLASIPEPDDGVARKLKDFETKDGTTTRYHLQPGEYNEKLSFDRHDEVLLDPGVYTLDKGLEVRDGAKFTAEEVVLHAASGGKKNSVKFSSSDITLSPPTSGPYAGITIFMGPGVKGKVEFRKDANPSVKGVIYAPNSEVNFKQTVLELDGEDDGDSGDDPDDPDDYSDDGSPSTFATMGASIVARKLKLDKKSHVTLTGNDIAARKPRLGVVE